MINYLDEKNLCKIARGKLPYSEFKYEAYLFCMKDV